MQATLLLFLLGDLSLTAQSDQAVLGQPVAIDISITGDEILFEEGILTFGFQGLFDESKGHVSSVSLNPLLSGFPVETYDADSFQLSGVSASVEPVNGTSVWLGTVVFVPEEIGLTTFDFIDLDPDLVDFVTGQSTVLDDVLFATPQQFEMHVVSEPASFWLALVCLLFFFRRRTCYGS